MASSASSGHTIDQEVAVPMTGFKVLQTLPVADARQRQLGDGYSIAANTIDADPVAIGLEI